MSEEIIRREFPVELTPSGDGRTLDLRIVPFNTVARVSDDGGRTQYDEMWMPGAFDRQLTAANRVLVNFEHQQGINGVIARGTELRDTGQALDGTFRMLSTQDADKALELVNEKVVGGVSLEAVATKSERGEDGIVRRVKARLINVALCRSPAFKDAAVLAVREKPAPQYVVNVGTSANTATNPLMVSYRETPPDEEPVPDDPEPEPDSAKASEAVLALQRIGYEPLAVRSVTRKPWVPSSERFTDEEYEASCVIVREGDAPILERASLPILEPDGALSVQALQIAASTLTGGRGGLRNVTAEQRSAAARRLLRCYRETDEKPSAALTALASR